MTEIDNAARIPYSEKALKGLPCRGDQFIFAFDPETLLHLHLCAARVIKKWQASISTRCDLSVCPVTAKTPKDILVIAPYFAISLLRQHENLSIARSADKMNEVLARTQERNEQLKTQADTIRR